MVDDEAIACLQRDRRVDAVARLAVVEARELRVACAIGNVREILALRAKLCTPLSCLSARAARAEAALRKRHTRPAVHMLPGGLVPSASAWTLLATTEISGLNNNDSGLNDGT